MLLRRLNLLFIFLLFASPALFAQASKYNAPLAEIDAYVAKRAGTGKSPALPSPWSKTIK